ncbi:MAG: aminoglycoside adenylyltransferase family protein [Candidatus Roizmanbacteria bacterium]|nr:aminoglycoside adenylyltransferase family protein [Candidatus Roizmanbacteria bacterium]
MEANDVSVNLQIKKCINLLKIILKDDLLGFYLYGSLLFGGLQKYSDIDLFAISKREATRSEKAQLEKTLLNISGIYAVSKDQKPIELTVVVRSDIYPWQYPPKFDFLYGDWLRGEFEAGNIEPWHSKVLPNLALVITQLLLSNRVLFGPSPNQLLAAVPYKDFFIATTSEIDSLMADLNNDTRNVLLTLARIWYTVETDTIASKSTAAAWAIDKLTDKYKPLMQRARAIYLGIEQEHWGDMSTQLQPCADYIVKKIREQTSHLNTYDYQNRTISLAK